MFGLDFSSSGAMAAVPAILLMSIGLALVVYGGFVLRRDIGRRVDMLLRLLGRPIGEEPRFGRRMPPIVRIIGSPGQRRAAAVARLFHLPPERAAAAFLAMRLGLAASLLVAFWLSAAHAGLIRSPVTILLLAVVAAGIGWLVPEVLAVWLAGRRLRTIQRGLPEAIELLVIGVEAGLALEDALDRVVVELRRSQAAVAEELALTLADMKILPNRQAALANLAQRIDLPSVRSVVTTLSQTMQYGTPLAQALRIVAAELRNDSLLRLEESANRMPVMLTIPMVVFILPSIFLIVGGPVILKLLAGLVH